jgi:hypothetical protein
VVDNRSPHQIGLSHKVQKDLGNRRRSTPAVRRSETAKAEAFIADAKEAAIVAPEAPKSTPKAERKPRAPKTYDFTADQLREARVGRSWADVAKLLGLPNPGAARKAWFDLTGEPHTAAPELVGKRARRGSSSSARLAAPQWSDLTDRQEIVDRLTNATITVKADAYGDTGAVETLRVARVRKYDDSNPDRPAVVFTEGVYRKDKAGALYLDPKESTGATRTIFIDRIVEVR